MNTITVPRVRRARPPVCIALTSRAMGSGKSTAAYHLVEEHGFVLVKFAGALKAMTRALLAELGEDLALIERRVEGDLKEQVVPALRRSTRYVMQRLGTEFGRELLHENVWADIVAEKIRGLMAAGKSVVIDDMRYRNELETVERVCGVRLTCVRLTRPGAAVTSAHSSEGELDHLSMPEIHNDGDLGDLFAAVDETLLPLARATSSH